jgi:hypothetical protein
MMLSIPTLMTFAFLILPAIDYVRAEETTSDVVKEQTKPEQEPQRRIRVSIFEKNIEFSEYKKSKLDSLTYKDKFLIVKNLYKYMVPLFFVYLSEYYINQGLFELLYFRNDPLISDHGSQYRFALDFLIIIL